jgi:putative ABC transport system substrate-binding protein
MKRRPFATLIAARIVAAGWLPSAAWASGVRAGSVVRIGWLSPDREESDEALQGRRLLHEGLRRAGYDEGRNLFVERRYAEGDPARLPALAQELVQAEVDLIIAEMHDAIAAARQATTRIPIVMLGGVAPIDPGGGDNLARPATNVTGITSLGVDGPVRALQVLKEAAPATRRVAVLFNGSAPGARLFGPGTDRKALSLGLQLEPFDVARTRDIGPSLRRIAARRADALLVVADPVIDARLPDILVFARRFGLVSIGTTREFAQAGGMLCVEPDRSYLIERTVVYADRILRGARPQDLPLETPGRYVLIVNQATAGKMGRELPQQLLKRADEVIE